VRTDCENVSRIVFDTFIKRACLLATLCLAGCSNTATSPSSTATAASNLIMTWPTLAFPTTGLGSTARTPVVITLFNNGSSAVPVTSVTDTNLSEFPWTTTCDFTGGLAPKSGCSVTAQFKPTDTGARTATLNISANSTTQSFALTGTAVGPVNPQLSIDVTSGPPSTVFTLTVIGGTPGGQLTLNTAYTPAQGNPDASFPATAFIADANGGVIIATTPDAPGTYDNWIVEESSGRSTSHVTRTVQ